MNFGFGRLRLDCHARKKQRARNDGVGNVDIKDIGAAKRNPGEHPRFHLLLLTELLH